MKREIKFRVFSEGKMQEVVKLDLEGSVRAYVDKFSFVRNPTHLMQFTGLKDKKGEEIYEGDVVISENNCVAEVRFNNGRFEIEFPPQRRFGERGFGGRIDDLCYAIEMKIEVIGNIYESKHLLDNNEPIT